MPLILKVTSPTGKPFSKLVKFKDDDTVGDAKKEISINCSCADAKYLILYSPTTQKWLNDSASLSGMGFKVKEEIFVYSRFQHRKVVVFGGPNSGNDPTYEWVVLDFARPLKEWMGYLKSKCASLLGDTEDDVAVFYEKDGDAVLLNIVDSFAAQGVPTSGNFCILRGSVGGKGEEEGKGKEEEESSGSGKKVPKFLSPEMKAAFLAVGCDSGRAGGQLDLAASAKSHTKNVLYAAYVHRGFKKKFEKVWVVLRTGHLFVYKTKDDPLPWTVIVMSNYMVKVVDKKKKFLFELAPLGKPVKGDPGSVEGGLEAFRMDDLEEMNKFVRVLNDNAGMRTLSTGDEGDGGKKEANTKTRPKNIFGGFIQDAVVGDEEIPEVLYTTGEILKKTAMDIEGIFRLSGDANKIRAYRELYNNGENVSFENERNAHNVAGVFKLYFRELADPLLTFELYGEFTAVETCNHVEAKTGYTRYLVNRLPRVNRSTLKYLIQLLQITDSHSKENNMAIHNLATVFGPNLLKSKNETMFSMAAATAQTNSVVHTLIEGYDIVFGEDDFSLALDRPSGMTGKALYDFAGSNDGELSFKKDDLITVVHIGGDGWSRGGIGKRFGKFPTTYTQTLDANVAARAYKKHQYMNKMNELTDQVEEEKKGIDLLNAERAKLEGELNALSEKKQQLLGQSEVAKERVAKILLQDDLLEGFLLFLAWHQKMQNRQQDNAKAKESLMEEMTSLKNGLPAAAKRKKKDKAPTLDQLRSSFDGTKVALSEEMEITRRLYGEGDDRAGGFSSGSVAVQGTSAALPPSHQISDVTLAELLPASSRTQLLKQYLELCRSLGDPAIEKRMKTTSDVVDSVESSCRQQSESVVALPKGMPAQAGKDDKKKKRQTKGGLFSK
eukprot:CAMPEP_0119125028 /NCGR_PEP_ID=MMETSP1310-20130426/4438_1 /TAXON_ID=464262 /ORGANISM="Genus nov. species nov., Strain RCC2339" /LENGTH=890 /DNA_ID=CAMNT_0007115045 /DNA_START=125 /DNA_END=2797 /DNA_ORIENTATION=-